MRVAVVGAGPAGFYTVEALLKRAGQVDVDLIERLPAPYGLLRYGVAPDHPKIKSVSAAYDRLCEDSRVRFLGNVAIGSDVGVDELRKCYDRVVFATGCQTDRRLGIAGENLPGSHSATEFVAWYNAHPDYASLPVDLGCERAIVVGIGDVALDVARILLRDPQDLSTTDISAAALVALRRSRVREVVILARRGPHEAAFAAKEFEDIAALPGVRVSVDGRLVRADLARLDTQRSHDRHKLEVLARVADADDANAVASRRLTIGFLVSPAEILGKQGRVTSVRIEHNVLERDEAGHAVARGTGRYETIPAGLVLRSVGCRGVAIAGLPFDESRGVVPNEDGRVCGADGLLANVYVAGWIKRGATGLVGTNRGDAAATVVRMLEDAVTECTGDASAVARPVIDGLLRMRGVRVVTWEGWKRIDQAERERGALAGKVREKLTDIGEMLEVAGA